jgi:hypothetical protein
VAKLLSCGWRRPEPLAFRSLIGNGATRTPMVRADSAVRHAMTQALVWMAHSARWHRRKALNDPCHRRDRPHPQQPDQPQDQSPRTPSALFGCRPRARSRSLLTSGTDVLRLSPLATIAVR